MASPMSSLKAPEGFDLRDRLSEIMGHPAKGTQHERDLMAFLKG